MRLRPELQLPVDATRSADALVMATWSPKNQDCTRVPVSVSRKKNYPRSSEGRKRTGPEGPARRTLDELGEYAAGRNPKGYTEPDVPRLIQEARSKKPRHRGVRSGG